VDSSFVTPVAANGHQPGSPIALVKTLSISLRAAVQLLESHDFLKVA
jgi:hypothetical protein